MRVVTVGGHTSTYSWQRMVIWFLRSVHHIFTELKGTIAKIMSSVSQSQRYRNHTSLEEDGEIPPRKG